MSRRTRACRRLSSRLSAALDGGPVDLELRRHLRGCVACSGQFQQYRHVRGVLRTLGNRVPQPAVPRPSATPRRRTALVLSGAASGVSLVTIVLAQRRRSGR